MKSESIKLLQRFLLYLTSEIMGKINKISKMLGNQVVAKIGHTK